MANIWQKWLMANLSCKLNAKPTCTIHYYWDIICGFVVEVGYARRQYHRRRVWQMSMHGVCTLLSSRYAVQDVESMVDGCDKCWMTYYPKRNKNQCSIASNIHQHWARLHIVQHVGRWGYGLAVDQIQPEGESRHRQLTHYPIQNHWQSTLGAPPYQQVRG